MTVTLILILNGPHEASRDPNQPSQREVPSQRTLYSRYAPQSIMTPRLDVRDSEGPSINDVTH